MIKKNKKLFYFLAFTFVFIIVSIASMFDGGLMGNWAEKVFINKFYDPTLNRTFNSFNWHAFKYFLILFALLSVCNVVIATYFLTSYFTSRNNEKTIDEVTENIEKFFDLDIDEVNFFPKKYSKIGFIMVNLKAERLKQEQKLKDVHQQKQDLITYLAHDLKTPLSSIIGYLSLLNELTELPADLRTKYTAITLDKTYRLEKLINEFFEISRYSLYTLNLNKTKLDLVMLLEQVVEEMSPLLTNQNQYVHFKGNDKSIIIDGDTERLSRVFDNLLKNAISYGDADSIITFEIIDQEQIVIVKVTNIGPILSEHQLNKIFKKFYRIDNARSSETGGSGLGLAIAKQIVEAHHGTLTAQSLDHRTTFEVKIPKNEN